MFDICCCLFFFRWFWNVPELRLPNMEMTIQECVDALIRVLETGGILTGGPADPTGLPMPDGDEIIDLHVAPRLVLISLT